MIRVWPPIALIIISIFGCQEDIIVEAVPPELGNTSGFAFGDSIFLQGTIKSLGSLPVEKHGFVISTSNTPTFGNPLDVVLHDSIEVNAFSTITLNKLEEDTQYYIAGFILTREDTVYGDNLMLKGKQSMPIALSMVPSHGYKGDLVKIQGHNFDIDKYNLSVKFGSQAAEIISSNIDEIVVKVPRYTISEEVNVVVEKAGNASSALPFHLDGVVISSFTPDGGMEEFEVTIQGAGFSEERWRNTVNIFLGSMQYATSVLSATTNELTIKIDANNISPGRYALSVTTDDVRSIASDSIEIRSPWTRLRDKPFDGVGYSASFEINGRLYVCGGLTASSGSSHSQQLWEYNTSADQWNRKADFPGGVRADAFAFSIEGKGYVGSGVGANFEIVSDLWEYDPALDSWKQKTNIPNGARADAVAFAYDGKGYVLFGTGNPVNPLSRRKDFWSYDPVGDTWTQMPDFEGNGRSKCALSIKNDKLYIIGGFDPNTTFDTDSWRYDFTTNQWSFIGYIAFQPQGSAYTSEKCYVVSMVYNFFNQNESHLFEYDPETNTRTFIRALFPGEFRPWPSIIMLTNNKIYVGLGPSYNSNYYSDLWVYPLTH
jgi:N-acetylneuraminic acid mutarotase